MVDKSKHPISVLHSGLVCQYVCPRVAQALRAPLVVASVLLRVTVREGLVLHRMVHLVTIMVVTFSILAPAAYAQELNCDDFPNQAAAQQELREDPSDPEGLDGLPGEAFSGIQGVACEDLPPPTDFDPVVPPGIGDPPKGEPSKGVPTKEGPPKGGVTKERPPKGGLPEIESPGEDKELLEAGGDLPLPQRSEAGDVPADGGGFSLWRISGMILSGGVLVFAVYRFFSLSR